MLACAEPGDLRVGQSIILTHTLNALRESGIDVSVGLLSLRQRQHRSDDNACYTIAFRANRASSIRSAMVRAALGGPLTSGEHRFLALASQVSLGFSAAIWMGLSWDPVSLRLPRVCSCPILHQPVDSLALSEITRRPGVSRALRVRTSRMIESRILRAGYVGSVYNSPQDAEFARSLAPPNYVGRVRSLPIGVDVRTFFPAAIRPRNPRIRVILSGAMDYRPNVDAAVFLVRDVLPRVQSEIEIRIVGRSPVPEVMDLGGVNPRVTVTGAVPSIADELRAADLFVAPMVSGGGISNKVLEAMACGLPVIVTPLVADNFADSPGAMLVGRSAGEIAGMIDQMAGNTELRWQSGAAATRYIQSGNWSWQFRTSQILEMLKEEIH
jgi:glycosyltransferase involved in cell wall biosynthesis